MTPMMRPDRRAAALDPVRYLWMASTGLALALSECAHPRAADLIDLHNRACDLLRGADLASRYRTPTSRVAGVQDGDWDALAREIVANRRHLSALRGSVSALLASIHDAGGWDVADRAHALRVGRAMEATEQALQDALAHRDDLLAA